MNESDNRSRQRLPLVLGSVIALNLPSCTSDAPWYAPFHVRNRIKIQPAANLAILSRCPVALLVVVTVWLLAVCLPIGGSAHAQVATGLVSFWDAEGNASDSIGNNPAILHGNVTFAQGISGQALGLDGLTVYMQVPNSPTLNLSTQATVMAWIYLDSLPSYSGHIMQILGKDQVGNDLDLQVETDNKVHFYVGAGASLNSPTPLQF